LAYESQRKNRMRLAIAKGRKIREAPGGGPSLLEPFPPKPARMRWKTYLDRRRKADDAERVFAEGLAELAARWRRMRGWVATPVVN
jgi:hypothetical protein